MAIPQQPTVAATQATAEAASGSWTWLLAFGVVAAAGVAGSGAWTSTVPEPPSKAAVTRPQSTGRAGLGPAADAGTAGAYAAVDAKRAGTASYTTGDLPSALERFEEAVAETPDDSEAQNNLGQILIRLGRAKDALPHFDAAIEIDGERWSYRFNRARAYGLLNPKVRVA